VNLIVIAKAPVAGRAKTRLSPPCTPEEAARLAEAALADTLCAVAATPADRRVVVLDGEPGAWLPGGCEVVAQRGGGLDERLAYAFEDVGGPALLIGMDTPQVTPGLLSGSLRLLSEADTVLGLALDGGFWALGLGRPDPSLLLGVPMSVADTGRRQRARLRAAGLHIRMLPALRDVDRIEDARVVAAQAPGGRFARTLAEIAPGVAERAA
jgi:rSAM/selenodomain-associated transferase 1